MSIDFPRAWQIARAAPLDQHHPKCSFRVTNGGILCDCDIINRHPETLSRAFFGKGGKPIDRAAKKRTT